MRSPFDDVPSPWIHVAVADISALTDWAHAMRGQDSSLVIRFVRGRKMKSVSTLFDEVSAAFQLPYYFGENWDALDECLGDLSWLQGRSYLVIVTDADRVLADAPGEFATFVGLLSRLGDEWSKVEPVSRPWAPEAHPFHVVFNVSATQVVSFEAMLRQAGIAFGEYSLPIRPEQ